MVLLQHLLHVSPDDVRAGTGYLCDLPLSELSRGSDGASVTIRGHVFFEDDVDAQGDFDQDARTQFLVCPVCGGPMADNSRMCRKCAPKAASRTPAGKAKLQRKRQERLEKALAQCPDGQRPVILQTKVALYPHLKERRDACC